VRARLRGRKGIASNVPEKAGAGKKRTRWSGGLDLRWVGKKNTSLERSQFTSTGGKVDRGKTNISQRKTKRVHALARKKSPNTA